MKNLLLCLLLLLPNLLFSKLKEKNKSGENSYLIVPALGYSTDTGFGFGATGLMYRTQDNVEPFKYSVVLQGFATTKGRQNHFGLF